MNILQNFPLEKSNTFGLKIDAKYYCEVASKHDILAAMDFCNEKGLEAFVLGGGSNVVFKGDYNGMVIHQRIGKVEKLAENSLEVLIRFGGGLIWDDIVDYTVEKGLGGIENLSLIPGSVGAAPVQNIGAYGAELADVLESVEAIDLKNGKNRTFSAKECEFGYRSSIFKTREKGRYIITEVILRLKKIHELKLGYGNLFDELAKNRKTGFTPQDVRQAVISIRRSKLPDPAMIGNAGSFFKNPEVPAGIYENLKRSFPELVAFSLPDGNFKLAAGWLIEKCGWKGVRSGNVGVYGKQALVIVNHGNARPQEIIEFADKIELSVKETFGVTLEKEVNIV